MVLSAKDFRARVRTPAPMESGRGRREICLYNTRRLRLHALGYVVDLVYDVRVGMSRELAFVLINPYTIAKSRTGGVIARYIGRTDLELIAARMYGPSMELVREYAELVRKCAQADDKTAEVIAEYIVKAYAPNPATGRPRRVMLLLFEGEDAVAKIWRVTGSATLKSGSGETVRDTYGDYVLNEEDRVQYFEPAVLVAPTKRRAEESLRLWSRYSTKDGGITTTATDVPAGERVETTLVLLKPDNFRFPSARPGNIIDMLSSSGLRIVGFKKFSMTVAQAEEFYGPIRQTLESKFREFGIPRAAKALSKEFGFEVSQTCVEALCAEMAPGFAASQFESIVEFMTGYKPSNCLEHEKCILGRENCLALVYEGLDAVQKIRSLLGPTDPSKAQPVSVRREYGSDIMVNAAHASDSIESARREMRIIKVEEDTISALVERYYGNVFSRMASWRAILPEVRCRFIRRVRNLWKTQATSANE